MAVAIPPTLSFAWIFHLSASCSFLLWPRSRAWPLLSPIVRRKQNGGCSAPVRAHPFSPLRGPLGPGPGAAPGGVRKHCGTLPSPRAAYFPPSRSFCLLLWPRARAHVLEHTPPHIQSIPAGQKGKSPPSFTRFTSLFKYIPGCRRMPGSYQFPKRETRLLCPEHGPEQGPWNPFP